MKGVTFWWYIKYLHSLCFEFKNWANSGEYKNIVHPESVAMIEVFHQLYNNCWCFVCVCIHLLVCQFRTSLYRNKETWNIACAKFTDFRRLDCFIYLLTVSELCQKCFQICPLYPNLIRWTVDHEHHKMFPILQIACWCLATYFIDTFPAPMSCLSCVTVLCLLPLFTLSLLLIGCSHHQSHYHRLSYTTP